MRSLWVDSELQIRAFQPPPIRASPSKYSNPPRMSSLELRGRRSFMWNKSRINTRPCMRRLTNPNKAGHHRVISQNRGGDKKWAISEIYFTNWNTARQDAHCGAEQPVIPPFFFVCVSTLPPLQLVGNLQFWLFSLGFSDFLPECKLDQIKWDNEIILICPWKQLQGCWG